MKLFPRIDDLTPRQFEMQVRRWLDLSGKELDAFETAHLERIDGSDGAYEFDVTARFRGFGGASFLVIVECKKHKNPIKREVVQALRDKQQSVGAQKSMVVSTAEFQSGAIEYAAVHNIALGRVIK